MGQIPVNRFGEAALEVMLGFPVERGLGGGWIYFVPEIMTGSVGHEADEARARAFRVRQPTIEFRTDGVDHLQIAARLAGADAIGVAGFALHQHP